MGCGGRAATEGEGEEGPQISQITQMEYRGAWRSAPRPWIAPVGSTLPIVGLVGGMRWGWPLPRPRETQWRNGMHGTGVRGSPSHAHTIESASSAKSAAGFPPPRHSVAARPPTSPSLNRGRIMIRPYASAVRGSPSHADPFNLRHLRNLWLHVPHGIPWPPGHYPIPPHSSVDNPPSVAARPPASTD
jgi:hypothetical protein